MKVTWITQAGLFIETDGMKIMIDPYLSDSVYKVEGKKRSISVDESLFDITPDVMIFTHDHLDHYDPETAPRFLEKNGNMLVLAPASCWKKAHLHGNGHRYVRFQPGTEWTEKNVRFVSVPAEHSDPDAIGVVIYAEGKCLYVTGDTLYSTRVLQALPEGIDMVFLPVNGVGNNMNMQDAARFACACGAKEAVPLHYGLFDDLDPKDFPFECKRILKAYEPEDI